MIKRWWGEKDQKEEKDWGMDTETVISKVGDAKRRALGRGLESLLPPRPTTVPEIHAAAAPIELPPAADKAAGRPLDIPLDKIVRNPRQTRTHFDQEKLVELALSIAASGVVQPIVVRDIGKGMYELITGERRWLASFEAKQPTIPAIVREVSDEQAMEMTIVENLQRADLNPMEQARAFSRLSQEFKVTQEQMALRTGMPRATVANFLRLLRLPEEVQQRVEKGELSFGHAKLLLGLETPEAMMVAAQKVVALSMSVRATETYVQGLLNPESRQKAVKVIEPLDANVKDIRDELQRALGLRVRIEDKDGKGRVIIEYTRLDDFDIIMRGLARL
jgi:ParB family chromosome partitioning protein